VSKLFEKDCIACSGEIPKLTGDSLINLQKELNNEWRVVDEHHLERTYIFKNFRQALNFTNMVGELAEEQNHHPDILLAWGKVKVIIWTHKIDGLTESDFIFAARTDKLNEEKSKN